jgi:hypothetical protein
LVGKKSDPSVVHSNQNRACSSAPSGRRTRSRRRASSRVSNLTADHAIMASSTAGVVRRPTIAMGNFVPTVSRNRCLLIVRQDNMANAVAHPCASYKGTRSTH